MRHINEFLLSKNKNNVNNSDENVLCYPVGHTFGKFMNDYSDLAVKQGFGFTLFAMKIYEVQEYIDNGTPEISVYKVPDEYKFISIKDLKFKYHEGKFSLSDCKLIYGVGM